MLGSTNSVSRVGGDLAIRLPRSDDAVGESRNEVRWLPHLAPGLPVAVRVVLIGRPSETFARPWTVVSSVQGDMPGALDDVQQVRLANSLGNFLQSLHPRSTPTLSSDPSTGAAAAVSRSPTPWTNELVLDCGARRTWNHPRPRDMATISADVLRPPKRPAGCTPTCRRNLLVHHDGRLPFGVIDFGGVGVGERIGGPALRLESLSHPGSRGTSGRVRGRWRDLGASPRVGLGFGPGLLTIANYRQTTMPARVDRLTSMGETIAGEVDIQLR